MLIENNEKKFIGNFRYLSYEDLVESYIPIDFKIQGDGWYVCGEYTGKCEIGLDDTRQLCSLDRFYCLGIADGKIKWIESKKLDDYQANAEYFAFRSFLEDITTERQHQEEFPKYFIHSSKQTVANLLRVDPFHEAEIILSGYARSVLPKEVYRSFTNHFREGEEAYFSVFQIMSTSRFIPSVFQQSWHEEIIQNRDKIMPLLVSKMLAGNLYADSIYTRIYWYGQKNGITDIAEPKCDDMIDEANARSTAMHYLTSCDAAEIFKSTHNEHILCEVNDLLHQVNSFIECGDGEV